MTASASTTDRIDVEICNGPQQWVERREALFSGDSSEYLRLLVDPDYVLYSHYVRVDPSAAPACGSTRDLACP